MEQQRIGVFRRMFLAVTDFRLYPFVVKEKTRKAVGYFIKLIFLCSIALSLFLMINAQEFINDELAQVEKKVPDFTIVDGELLFSGDVKLDISPIVTLDMRNDYSQNVPMSNYSDDKIFIVVTKDSVRIGNSAQEELYPTVNFKDVTPLNKQELISNIKAMNDDWVMKAYFYSIILAATFIYYLINRAWLLIMYMLALFIFDGLFVVKMKITDFLKLAIYISTFPIILEVFAICIGSKYNSTASFITFLIAMVYAFYALRALRLDAMISNVAGNTPEEKIENAIKDAQEELEKQLKEMEQEAEKRDLKEIEEEKAREETAKGEKTKEEKEEEQNNKK